jgi:eukaryotic-like serine/threonine-protein kinase
LDLVWLPDGGGLLTTYQDRKTGSPRVQVGIVSQPGGYFRPITNDTNTYDTLTLAADGRTLAAVQERYTQTLYVFPSIGFGGNTPDPAPAQDKDSDLVGWASNGDLYFDGPDLVRISADGHVRTTLISDPTARIYRPTDCQGGRYVVFAWADHHGSKKINLWRVDADGSNPKQLTDGTRDMAPQCSPDGKWVYFYNHTTAQMMRVGIDGGLPEIVPGTSLPGLTLPISWPLFGIARDGKTLTFLAAKSESGFVTQIIALVHLNSTSTPTTRLLVPDQRISGWPQFTPGGTAVVYPVHSGADNLWLQPLDGSVGHQITNFQSDAIVMFEFSPDGKTLAVMRSHSESAAVLLHDTSSR